MKKVLTLVLVVPLFSLAGSAWAQDSNRVGVAGQLVEAAAIESSDSATLALPEGVTLREIIRMYRSKTGTHSTNFYWPENWHMLGWRLEGTLGFLSATPFENSKPLYSCNGPGNWNYFTSPDSNCEGQYAPEQSFIGHISTMELPGTVPLYRCVVRWKGRDWRHLDTPAADCEGNASAVNDGILGYMFL